MLRNETCGEPGTPCFVLESTPRTPTIAGDAGYSRRINWVRADNLVPVKTEFYDLNGSLLKTMDSSDLKQVDAGRGRWQAMRVSVSNHQTGHHTLIQLEKFTAGLPVPDDEFTARFLEKEQ